MYYCDSHPLTEAREARGALVQTMTVKNKVSDMTPEMHYQVTTATLPLLFLLACHIEFNHFNWH